MTIPSLSKNYAAITYLGDLVPLSGRGTPIAPPTYMEDKQGNRFARSEAQPVPTRELGYRDFVKDPDTDALLLRPSVVVNSLGAEATKIETAIISNEDKLGITLPGIFLDADKTTDTKLHRIASGVLKKNSSKTQYSADLLAAALRDDLEQAHASTWMTPHRHTDTYIRHSEIGGTQIWANPESEEYQIIAAASKNRADLLFRYFPDSALFGFWLTSVAPRRHKLARSLSPIVTGYDAHDVAYGATKGDVLGGISSQAAILRDPSTLELIEGTKPGKEKASEVGLGLIATEVQTRAFTCGSILRQASISLGNLRHLSVPGNPNESYLIADVLAWLGVFGLLLAEQDGFFRSGCDLITVRDTSGFTLVNQDGNTQPWDIDLDGAIAGFREAYDRLPENLRFEDRIYTEYPESILTARATTLIAESKVEKGDK